MSFVYQKEYDKLYVNADNRWPFLLLFLLLVLIAVVNKVFPRFKPTSILLWLSKGLESKYLNYVVFSLFFIFSIFFSLTYDISFRQSGENSLSSSGGIVIVYFALKAYAKAYLLYIFFKLVNGLRVLRVQRLFVGVIAFSLLIAVVGSLDMIYVLFSVIIAFNKGSWFMANESSANLGRKVYKTVFFASLILILSVAVIFVGNANKIGVDNATEEFAKTENVSRIFARTSLRVSNWYSSLIAIGGDHLLNNEVAYETLDGVTYSFNSRVNTLLGLKGKEERPRAWSSSRMSYLLTYNIINDPRTGSSPGLAASALLLPFFPFNFILIAIFAVFVLRQISKGFRYANVRLSFLGRFLIVFFINSLWDSPVDLINIINPSPIYVLGVMLGMAKIESMAVRKVQILNS